MSRRTHPWAAGVFDMGGWVKIAKRGGGAPFYRDFFSLRVAVSTRHRAVANQLEAEFKGHTSYMRTLKKCFWQLTDKQAVKFLTAIKPYVVSKQKQIEIGLAFAERKSKYRYLNMTGQEKRDEQDDFRTRLLEARGRLPEGGPHV